MTYKCHSCGAEARPAFRFCPVCGGNQFGAQLVSPSPTHQVPTRSGSGLPPVPKTAVRSIDVSAMRYAGFWRRAAAWAVDQLIPLLLFSFPVMLVLNPTRNEALLLWNLVGAVISWLYFALQECSRHQATFGKRAFGPVVADMNGQRLSFARATGHHFARIPSALLLLAGTSWPFSRSGARHCTTSWPAWLCSAGEPDMATPQRSPQSGLWRGSPPAPAPHWRRLTAIAIDMTLLTLPSLLAAHVLPLLGALLVPCLYFSDFEASSWQATPGKRLLKLRVVDVNGVALHWPRATLRYFCRFLTALPLGAGYALALFNLHRQGLHDMLASTRVVMR